MDIALKPIYSQVNQGHCNVRGKALEGNSNELVA